MNPRCHDITHPPLKGGVTVTNSPKASLAAAITALASMTDEEFYTACEAIGLTIHDDRTPEPNNIRSITQ